MDTGATITDDRAEFVMLYSQHKIIEQRIPDENCSMMSLLVAQYNLNIRQHDYNACRVLIDRLLVCYRFALFLS